MSRRPRRERSCGPVTFTLYPQDWRFPAGHRIGVLFSGGDIYWFIPSDTGIPVTVTGGALTLPALRCERDEVTTDHVPNFVPRGVPAPFNVGAAAIAAATVDGPLPAPMVGCESH